MSWLRPLMRWTVITGLRLVPSRWLERLVAGVVAGKAYGLPPAEALRLLFRLDQRLYTLQGDRAIAYGGGAHPKHRLIPYHDFFIAHIRDGERVLDVGCGIGAVAYDVAQRTSAEVVGIDRDAKKLAQAGQRYAHPRLSFVEGDALTTLPGQRFDVVILSNLLEHVDDRVGFLRRLLARIQPARVLIRVPLFERDWRVALKRELGVDYRLDPTHCIEHRADELTQELERAGLALQQSVIRWGELWAVAVPTPAGRARDAVEAVTSHA